ncbi:hypothetical protein A9K55_005888 [Cordyceps militaris]|uniref:Uncharacterized protein n=1 Tax=Cordyceps militaris TaxID=73501 RepID=A0A2H4SBI8_CORMI|nr:hypothetical protein A9K55_005888 [Cordyceps militaris]
MLDLETAATELLRGCQTITSGIAVRGRVLITEVGSMRKGHRKMLVEDAGDLGHTTMPALKSLVLARAMRCNDLDTDRILLKTSIPLEYDTTEESSPKYSWAIASKH